MTGTVRDADGAPIANARITAHAEWTRAERIAHTGLDGAFELALPARNHQLVVEHDDFCRGWETVDVRDQDRVADFALGRGGVVRGRVVARDTGKPVARAIVHAYAGEGFASAEADDDGAFTLRTLDGGMAILSARGRGYASSAPTRLGLDAGKHVDGVEVTVDPAFSISGRVVLHDAPSQGIAAVTVRAHNTGAISASAISNADGAFEIHGVAPGKCYLVADGAGILLQTAVTVVVVDRDIVDVVLMVRRGVTLSGRVEPPGAAQIGLTALGPDPARAMRNMNLHRSNTESDAAGAFSMRGVPIGDFEIFAMASDGRSGRVPVTVGGEDADGFVIHLAPRRSASGRVVDTAGRPLADYHVRLSRLDVSAERRFRTDSSYRSATTAADGSFTLVGLEPGRHELTAQGGTGGSGIAVVIIDVTDGDRSDVVLTIDLPTAQIRGQILDVDRKPAGGLLVMARRGSHPGSAQTDRHGNFVIENVPAGTYSLFGLGPTSIPWRSEATTDEPVTIVLSPLGSLTVEVATNGIHR